MLWFVLGLLVGHYVISDIKSFIKKRSKSDD